MCARQLYRAPGSPVAAWLVKINGGRLRVVLAPNGCAACMCALEML